MVFAFRYKTPVRRFLHTPHNLPNTTNQETDMNALADKISDSKKVWDDVDLALRKGCRVLLYGPPGTGKSFAGITSNIKPEDVYRLYLTLDTPGAEVRGHYLPSTSGGFEWHDGPATKAWRTGGRLIIDEIDAASGDTLTLLLGYLDDAGSARITLPTNETVTPNPSFSCLATTNQTPASLPEALRDRFDVTIHVTLPNPKAFDKAHWFDASLFEAAKRTIYLNDAPVKDRNNRPIGLRSFKSIDKLRSTGLPLEDAARLAIGADASRWLCSAVALASSKI